MVYNFTKTLTESDLSRAKTKLKLRLTDFKKQNIIPIGSIVNSIDRLPAYHLEQLKEITYDAKRTILTSLTQTEQKIPIQSQGIYIQKHRTIAIFNIINKDLFLHTLFHEIGHHVYFCIIGQRLKNIWVTDIYRKDSFITNYASLNAAEDFAESYASYLLNPQGLETIPIKYNFLKNFLFEGKERPTPPEKLNLHL